MLKFLFKNKIKNTKIIVGESATEYYVHVENVEEFQKLGMAQTHLFYKKNMTNEPNVITLDTNGLIVISSVEGGIPETLVHSSRCSEEYTGNLARLIKYVSIGTCNKYDKELTGNILEDLANRGHQFVQNIERSKAKIVGRFYINNKGRLKVKEVTNIIIDDNYKYRLGDLIKVENSVYCMTPTGLMEVKNTEHLV